MRANLWAVAGLMMLAGACTQQAAPTMKMTPAPPVLKLNAGQQGHLTLVTDRSLVCMVNDQHMGQPQIPVEVSGRTYYGCCEMCKDRLANDATFRTATDPVSQRPVDKATAVIGITQDNSALYFESDQTFAAYSRQAAGAFR
ncbi:hypothetical protein [Myxococcus sp. AB056]|uniref:hypothetical protein n=1 Tax=Myxococcus sp. AB056 TaxID=2562792 RepID=UPI001E5DDED8|nr:hypothetical protein [Myxococcus sp. AB056]